MFLSYQKEIETELTQLCRIGQEGGKKRKRNCADKENLSNSQLVSGEDVIMKDLVFFVLHQKDFVIN